MASKDARCILQVQFDRSDRTFRPGERITGTIEILPGARTTCRRIILAPRWVARGVGPEDTAQDPPLVLPGGVWPDNEKVALRFDFPAPAGPLSYQGEGFEVAWRLEVKADLAMATDVSAVEKFTLTHGVAEIGDRSRFVADAYNPFAALAPEVNAKSETRPKPPVFYAILGNLPRMIVLPLVAVLIGYLIGMRREYFPDGYEAPIIWGLIILFSAFAITGRFRRKMRERGREARNQQMVTALTNGQDVPRMPGRYWQKARPDESQRGWARSGGAFVLAASALLLMVTGLVGLQRGPEGSRNWLLLIPLLVGLWLAARSLRPVIRSWAFVRTAMTFGPVEVGILPPNPRCGDELYVSLDFRPARQVQISKATATLVAHEVAERFYRYFRPRDAGQPLERVQAAQAQRRAHRFLRARSVRRYGVKFAEGRSLLPQESAGLAGKIQIPPDAPPTFIAQDHKLLWVLVLRIVLSDGLQWSKDVPICLRA